MFRGESTASPPNDFQKAVVTKGKGVVDTDQAIVPEIEMYDSTGTVSNKGTNTASTSSTSDHQQIIIETAKKVMEQLQKKKERLTSERGQVLTECCVYRVHKSLRNVKPQAYTPQLISIGPLHRGNAGLKPMENQKLRYFEQLIQRNKLKSENIRDLVISIKKKEEYIRACYSESYTKIQSWEFLDMILLDAVFIIEFLRDSNDDRHLSPWMIFDIREDLMLLENQLPFSIIEEIYDEVNSARQVIEDVNNRDRQAVEDDVLNHAPKPIEDIVNRARRETVLDVNRDRQADEEDVIRDHQAVEDVNRARQAGEDVNRDRQDTFSFLKLATVHFAKYTFTQGAEPIEGRNFTDLLRNFMLNGALKKSNDFSDPIKLKYSAVMLRKAGVKFRVTQDKCLVNIKFEDGVLKIPRLEVEDSFERFIRNLMAFEQCHKPSETYICSYFKFMDHLINSAEDVGLLVKERIILNWLGDDAAVSNLINNLSQNIIETHTCYNDICQSMNEYYENKWNHRKATLKLVYFSNVWRGTGTIAAAILLILTLIQTIVPVVSLF